MLRSHRSLLCGTGVTALLGGALLASAVAPAHAATNDPAPINFFITGALKPGATIDLNAECGRDSSGAFVGGATVTGFNGVKARLTPWGAEGQLGAKMTVPKTYTQDSAVLKLECDNKVTRTATVRTATAAKPAQKAPTATNTPARVLPKGGAQTGGGAPISDQGSTVPLVLGGVGALGLVGAGAVALRRRAEARG